MTVQHRPRGHRRPILVTGAHRSGSTWLGKTLASSPDIGYISEPFSPNHSTGVCSARFPLWYTYIPAEHADPRSDAIRRMLTFDYSTRAAAASLGVSVEHWARRGYTADSRQEGAECWVPEPRPLPRPVRRLARDAWNYRRWRRANARPLMKDPMALFSSEWLANSFDMQVIVLVRHPAAFASSLKRMAWDFPFSHFLRQPDLMRDHLGGYEERIIAMTRRRFNIVEQASLLWCVIYSTAARLLAGHPDWIGVTHEQLAVDPYAEYPAICRASSIPYGREIEAAVASTTDPSNPTEPPAGAAEHLSRNSRRVVASWHERLTDAEITLVRRRTEEAASVFYTDKSWTDTDFGTKTWVIR